MVSTNSTENVIVGRRSRIAPVRERGTPHEGKDGGASSLTETREAQCEHVVVQQNALDPNGPESPDIFLRQLVSLQFGIRVVDKPLLSDEVSADFFDVITEEEMSHYNTAVATAVRENNVEDIRKLQQAGVSLNCCNRFGESLLHIACRRGFVEMVKLILDQPDARVKLSDDCGRTPLHDLCWNPSPQLEICKWLLDREPSLFFFCDKRHFTPFAYTRQEHWQVWKNFILENKDSFKALEHQSYSFLRSREDNARIIG